MARIGIGIGSATPKRGLVKPGLMAEYKMQKVNLFAWSDPTSLSQMKFQQNVSIATLGQVDSRFVGGIAFADNSTTRQCCPPITVPANSVVCVSVYVKMDDGSVPNPSTNSNSGDFSLVNENGVVGLTYNPVEDLGGGLYRVSGYRTTPSAPVHYYGVIKYNTQSAKGFKVSGFQLNLGSTPLPYEKTTDNQTLWNSKTDSLAVSNAVVNGNFANGISGWEGHYANLSSASNTLTLTATGANSVPYALNNTATPCTTGHLIYTRGKFRVTNTNCTQIALKISGTTGGAGLTCGSLNNPTQNQWYPLSGIAPLTGTYTGNVQVYFLNQYADAATANGKVMEVQEVLAIDLTALFGAGNEPTQDQCDTMFANWFNGTQTQQLPKYNGQLGSTTGADTNDPTFTGQGLSFSTDDYVKLPYMIDANQDFTVYLVANVGVSLPAGAESYFSIGNSGSPTQKAYLRRISNGDLGFYVSNDAGVNVTAVIPQSSIASGIRLFAIKRNAGQIILKDLINKVTGTAGTPSSPITLNQSALGSLLVSSASAYLNQPQYHFASFNRATTDVEDKRMLNYVKRELAKSGIPLGGRNEFMLDFAGKVAGSTIENANKSHGSIASGLQSISNMTGDSNNGWVETGQTTYDQQKTLDSVVRTTAVNVNGRQSQHLFQWDIINSLLKQGAIIPGETLADKVAWMKANLQPITCNWWGYGSSPSGNRAYLTFWDGSVWYNSPLTNISNSPTKLSTNISQVYYINSSGMTNILAYADPSDGVTPSTINTDYAQLVITLKPGVYL